MDVCTEPNIPGACRLEYLQPILPERKPMINTKMKTDNKSLVKDYIELVLNTGDISLIPKFVSPDYVEIYNNKKYSVGIEGAKEHIIGVQNNYPDIKLSIRAANMFEGLLDIGTI